MSRYLGPRKKIMRALGTALPGLGRHDLGEQDYPPGQHGARRHPERLSGFGRQLREKQKIRFNYGLTERQLRRVVKEARRHQGSTGQLIVELLERRLDNLVFRAGFAPTIPAARQLVCHGKIRLNGRKATIPSMRLKQGDQFGPTDKARILPVVQGSLLDPALALPEWLSLDPASNQATLRHHPGQDCAPFPVDLQLVVEYYATRL